MIETDKQLDSIITAVKYSYLVETSKKVLMFLLSVKYPVKLAFISNETGYGKSHTAGIIKRLISEKLVKRKKKSVGVYEYTYTKECNKFLNMQESLIFYKKKMEYNNVIRKNNKSIK